MLILPAIDLRGGRCVRLQQGDFARETVFSSEPEAIAQRWANQGATYLHIVDLDGAKQGHPVNSETVRRIAQIADIRCQLGGGLRTEEHIAEALAWGVDRVVVGTQAFQDPVWFESICRHFPGKVVLGIDAKEGQVAIQGWLQVSKQSALDLARQCEALPLAALIYTDIRRDGMLQGPNLDAIAEMARSVRLPVIASGGVSTIDDVRSLARLGVAGCIVGRALYEGRLLLPEALEAAET